VSVCGYLGNEFFNYQGSEMLAHFCSYRVGEVGPVLTGHPNSSLDNFLRKTEQANL